MNWHSVEVQKKLAQPMLEAPSVFESRNMVSKFKGTCVGCLEEISLGQLIRYYHRLKQATHRTCEHPFEEKEGKK
jgi:hypothetical protein